MDLNDLNKILADQPAYRYRQIKEAVFKHLISGWDEAKNLPKELREKLIDACPLEIMAEEFQDKRSAKAAIRLADGNIIESVLINNNDGRHTVCVSSQVGCPVGCGFCATGKIGFKRNLSADEIVLQVLYFARQLQVAGDRVDNVVFMGMGEPFLNYENVFKAVEILNDKEGINIGARSISISTVGIIEGIKKIAKFPLQVNLAISLHAPNDKLRDQLIPINKKYPIKRLWQALEGYLEETNRKVMIEYVMIAGINDSDKLAEELAQLIGQLPKKLVMVNLIPYNPTGDYKASPASKLEAFKNILGRSGIEAVVRESLGQNIAGACGQLAGKNPAGR